jgi:hypothetical protein
MTHDELKHKVANVMGTSYWVVYGPARSWKASTSVARQLVHGKHPLLSAEYLPERLYDEGMHPF